MGKLPVLFRLPYRTHQITIGYIPNWRLSCAAGLHLVFFHKIECIQHQMPSTSSLFESHVRSPHLGNKNILPNREPYPAYHEVAPCLPLSEFIPDSMSYVVQSKSSDRTLKHWLRMPSKLILILLRRTSHFVIIGLNQTAHLQYFYGSLGTFRTIMVSYFGHSNIEDTGKGLLLPRQFS